MSPAASDVRRPAASGRLTRARTDARIDALFGTVAGDGGRRDMVGIALSGRRVGDDGEGNVSLVVGRGAQSDVLAARQDLFRTFGCTIDDAVAMQQVHGAQAAVVGKPQAGRGMRNHRQAIPGVDVLVTFDSGVALMVMVADCVPVVLVGGRGGVGVVHAGRAGVMNGVVAEAVRSITQSTGGRPRAGAVQAIIGPAIGGCCYEVPKDLRDALPPEVSEAATTTSWGTPSIDLRAAVAAQLSAVGVAHIDVVGDCTRCQADTHFSHRHDPGAGRQAMAVVRWPLGDLGADPVHRSTMQPVEVTTIGSRRFLDWQL